MRKRTKSQQADENRSECDHGRFFPSYEEPVVSIESDVRSCCEQHNAPNFYTMTSKFMINATKSRLEGNVIDGTDDFEVKAQEIKQLTEDFEKVTPYMKKLIERRKIIGYESIKIIAEEVTFFHGSCQRYLDCLAGLKTQKEKTQKLFEHVLIAQEVVPCFDDLYPKVNKHINRLITINIEKI